jgi:hypothetical protein
VLANGLMGLHQQIHNVKIVAICMKSSQEQVKLAQNAHLLYECINKNLDITAKSVIYESGSFWLVEIGARFLKELAEAGKIKPVIDRIYQ